MGSEYGYEQDALTALCLTSNLHHKERERERVVKGTKNVYARMLSCSNIWTNKFWNDILI